MGGDYIKMYKLQPAYKDYVWGGNKLKKMYDMKNGDRLAESWALSVHPDGSSMYLASFADYVKSNPKSVDKHGSTFPVRSLFTMASLICSSFAFASGNACAA